MPQHSAGSHASEHDCSRLALDPVGACQLSMQPTAHVQAPSSLQPATYPSYPTSYCAFMRAMHVLIIRSFIIMQHRQAVNVAAVEHTHSVVQTH